MSYAIASSQEDDGILFRLSADTSLKADYAQGDAQPNFLSHVSVVNNGKVNGAAQWEDDGVGTWNAAANVYARRGSVAFYWRSRTPVGEAPFNIFRIGFADHSSWDMAFLRIDWNGHGFDAFVTDTNLARVRVSSHLKQLPAADKWLLLTFTWDETEGVRLYVDGNPVASKLQKADLDSGLDQFGFAGRIVSPHQVQSRYHFMRGSDFDELKVFDHALSAIEVTALSSGKQTRHEAGNESAERLKSWLHRYGWDTPSSVLLTSPSTTIKKVEFTAAYDIKEEMRKGIDGIAETTWPGVYNRSTLPGRDDYFELPDWNVYVRGGKQYDLLVPSNQKFNRVEIRGAAFGTLNYATSEDSAAQSKLEKLDTRQQGIVRSVSNFAEHNGGMLRFINTVQETPIQELWAYDVHAGAEPKGTFKLSYRIKADAAPEFPCIKSLVDFIDGRYPSEERSIAVALPISAKAAVAAGSPTDTSIIKREKNLAPLVHILIPSAFDDSLSARPLSRAWNYGWQNSHDGLDGIAIDIPALQIAP
ncbi:MAG TPA: LamG-like jellyroll fold domain-containing protein, partial [Steroidobacteraceae bacterium]|nr:LamG-like jellyroll fold domain-containing protein [Steroidobacteraceae bacterium]